MDAKKAKKNIGNKSLILHLFRRKIANIMKKIEKIVTLNYNTGAFDLLWFPLTTRK